MTSWRPVPDISAPIRIVHLDVSELGADRREALAALISLPFGEMTARSRSDALSSCQSRVHCSANWRSWNGPLALVDSREVRELLTCRERCVLWCGPDLDGDPGVCFGRTVVSSFPPDAGTRIGTTSDFADCEGCGHFRGCR